MNCRNYSRILLLITVTIVGVRPLPANGLSNPGFESPVTSGLGNHFPATIPGWTLIPFAAPCESGHNIVRTDGSPYDGGPDRAAGGSQYYDICGAAGSLWQTFTLAKDSLVHFGASFSRRDLDSGGGNVEIYDVTGITLIAAAPLVAVAAGESQEIWRTSSGSIPTLPAGTYVFRINLDDTANVDNAFLYMASTAGGRFEAGNGTPESVSEGLLDWALAAAGAPIVLNGGNTPYTVPLTTTKVPGRTLLTLNGNNTATLSGQGGVQLFRINAGLEFRLEDISLDRGYTAGSGGAIQNLGTLTLNNVRITNCVAGGHGGAIQNSNILTCFNSKFEYNRAGINGGALDTVVSAILNGCVASNNSAGFRGGGFYNYLGLLQTSQCYVKWNSAGAYGGGIAVDGGTLRSSSDRIRGNRSSGAGGGMSLYGDCIVSNPQVTLNSAATLGGAADVGGVANILENAVIHSNKSGAGAVSVRAGTETLWLSGASVRYNEGGGILVDAGTAIITSCRISNNDGTTLTGSALEVYPGQNATLWNCIIANNSGNFAQVASTRGTVKIDDCRIGPGPTGGIGALRATFTLSRTTIFGNGTTNSLGGVYLQDDATATLTNCTVSGNTSLRGGGFHVGGGPMGGCKATLTNVTVFGNSAPTGGNVFITNEPGVSMTLTNCIIANPGSGGNCAGKTITSSRYSISSDNLCALAGPGDRNNTNPLLGPLQDNGGPTPTHAPLAGSPAIDGVSGWRPRQPISGDGTGPPAPASTSEPSRPAAPATSFSRHSRRTTTTASTAVTTTVMDSLTPVNSSPAPTRIPRHPSSGSLPRLATRCASNSRPVPASTIVFISLATISSITSTSGSTPARAPSSATGASNPSPSHPIRPCAAVIMSSRHAFWMRDGHDPSRMVLIPLVRGRS